MAKADSEEMIRKYLRMFVDYDADDWKSVTVYTSTEKKRLYDVEDVGAPYLEINLNSIRFCFKDTKIQLIIRFAKKEPEEYWKYYIRRPDMKKDKNILWSIELYPSLLDDYSYAYIGKNFYSAPFWYFISKDIKDMVYKIMDNYKKYDIDERMKRKIDDTVDAFYKKKSSKDIKHNNSISNRSNTNTKGEENE